MESMGDRADRAGRAARDAVPQSGKEASQLAVHLGRAGIAAQGVLYLILAWLAAQIALGGGGGGGEEASSSGALSTLVGQPFGAVLLVLLALGFTAYVVWQVLEAAGQGLSEPNAMNRAKAIVQAIVGLALLITTIRVLTGGGQSSGGEQEATSTALSWPGGQVVVALVGLGVVGFGGYTVYRGFTGKIREKLEAGVDGRLIRLGQIGDVARGLAFMLIGVLVVSAAVRYEPETSGGLDNALQTLRDQPFGPFLVFAVALGFAAWGVFCVLTARRHKKG